jgi:hypothetical protein
MGERIASRTHTDYRRDELPASPHFPLFPQLELIRDSQELVLPKDPFPIRVIRVIRGLKLGCQISSQAAIRMRKNSLKPLQIRSLLT